MIKLKRCCKGNLKVFGVDTWICNDCGNVYMSYKKGESMKKQINDLSKENKRLKACLRQLGEKLI